MMKLAVLSCLVAMASLTRGADWHYEGAEGPDNWAVSFPACGYNSQSPIDINTGSTVKGYQYTSIHFSGYHKQYTGFQLTNNGHTVQVNTNNNLLRISGAALTSEYALQQFHFHWGQDDHEGSEHLVDGKSYPFEIHFVHYKTKFADVSSALSEDGAVAVVGVFAEITTNNDPSPAFARILSHLSSVPYKGDVTTMAAFNVSEFLPTRTHEYYRYRGSLTTPPCAEGLVWTVLKKPIKITSAQLQQFRDLHAASPDDPTETIEENHRPPQPLNGRTVYRTPY